jgi:hypothetical protein
LLFTGAGAAPARIIGRRRGVGARTAGSPRAPRAPAQNTALQEPPPKNPPKPAPDIERLCRRVTLDVIGRAGFGYDFQARGRQEGQGLGRVLGGV